MKRRTMRPDSGYRTWGSKNKKSPSIKKWNRIVKTKAKLMTQITKDLKPYGWESEVLRLTTHRSTKLLKARAFDILTAVIEGEKVEVIK